MSLLDAFGHKCVIMEKDRQPDGAGGWLPTEWREGAEFVNYRDLNTSMETRSAEKLGVTSVYDVLVDKAVPIDYDDLFRDKETGAVYRVTSHPNEKQAPKTASIQLNFFTAERTELPK